MRTSLWAPIRARLVSEAWPPYPLNRSSQRSCLRPPAQAQSQATGGHGTTADELGANGGPGAASNEGPRTVKTTAERLLIKPGARVRIVGD